MTTSSTRPVRGPEPAGSASFVRFEREAIEQSIPRRFETQAHRDPERLAVETREHVWSYETLNRAANRIAHALVAARGAEPEPVALVVGQGAPLVAAILGVLKAGKVYAPLDPADPEPRLADLVRDTRAAVVLAEARTMRAATAVAPPGALVLDVSRAEAQPDEDLALPIAPAALAYVYYTSGSTGRPKGVVDAHRNVLHNVMRYTNSLEISPEDRLTLLQGPSFSGAVSSLFGALLNGAAVFPFDVGRRAPTRSRRGSGRGRSPSTTRCPPCSAASPRAARRCPRSGSSGWRATGPPSATSSSTGRGSPPTRGW